MRRKSTGLVFWGAVALVFALGSCSNQMLPVPVIRPSQQDEKDGLLGNRWGAPQALTASQGKRRAVALSWEPVADAVRYFIYKSESPLADFIQCGETAGAVPNFEALADPGATVYYTVAALNKRNELSARSTWVIGRSLAQPLIYSIEPNPADPAGSVIVYWSMNNLGPNTYEKKIRYTLYCYEGSTEKAKIEVSGSFTGDPFAAISGLSSSSAYQFLVEVRLEDDAALKELSEKTDAETARRLNPAAPVDLAAVPGGGKQSVSLSFKLPEKVDFLETVSGVKGYTPHGVYFVISRRIEGSNDPFEICCGYLGEGPARAGAVNPVLIGSPYTPGAAVSWTDTAISEQNRGQKYEYRVQSFVDGTDKTITTSAAIALVSGWAMAPPRFTVKAPVYTGGEEDAEYTGARLSLNFTHDTRGVTYNYKLKETIRPIGDGNSRDLSGPVDHEYSLSYSELAAYTAQIDLTQPSTAGSKGRGFYSYSIKVFLGETEIERLDAVGSVRVFEKNTSHLTIKNFELKDGYTDKFVLVWTWQKDRTYIIDSAAAAAGPWTQIALLAPSDAGDGSLYSYTDTAGISPGLSRYYSIRAREGGLEGISYYSGEAKILGQADLSAAGSLSYDTIPLAWAPVSGADNYRVLYKYPDDSDYASTALIPAGSLSLRGGKYVYGFKPLGSAGINAALAGKPLELKLEALNEARRLADGGGELKTTSGPVNARLFGPSGLERPGALTVTANTSLYDITFTWREVEDAAGYYVVRRQYQMNDSPPLSGGETLYYVRAGTHTITGIDVRISGNTKENSDDIPAELAYAAGVYTLTDKALQDAAYAVKKDAFGVYANEQNDIPWGYPYHYFVVPVLSENDLPSIGADKSCALGGVTYSAASMAPLEKTGRTLGFVTGVKATKGTFSGPGDDGLAANTGIRISWPAPGMGGELSYSVFRRAQDSEGAWTPLTPSPISGLYYDDMFDGAGGPRSAAAYEYLVGVSAKGLSSRPDENARFIAKSREAMDADFPREREIAGYVLPQPAMYSASRVEKGDAAAGYFETVEFFSTGVESLNSAKERGIDGYVIQVRDQSSARAWKTIREIPLADLEPVPYTARYRADARNINGLLNVLRDYRHYYRVRSYVEAGEKILSPPPADPGITGAENDYIKWGARPITAKEFAGLTSLAIGTAIAGTGCDGGLLGKTVNKSITGPVFFLSAGGNVSIKAGNIIAGSSIREYNGSSLTFSSPADAPFNYGGSVSINSLTGDGGTYSVNFNGALSVERKFIGKPFTFGGKKTQNCDGFYLWDTANGWQ
ncbi:MAG: hypothetical protein LBK02_09510 [Treponema sp.]|nr:hypothetical protein [Treponema sp.]